MTRPPAGVPGVLLVLDGWGEGPAGPDNALTTARTPVLDGLRQRCPATLLAASGEAVGLLPGTVGNSEIGHMVIGAGRALPYDSLLVQRDIDSGRMRDNERLNATCTALAANDRALHLVGLCSDGQIHAHVDHLAELLATAATRGVPRVWIHAITDGRDVADGTARSYLQRVAAMTQRARTGRVASVIGRGYALDKAGDLTLTTRAVLAITDGEGTPLTRAEDAVGDHSDEWVVPSVLTGNDGHAVAPVTDGDAVLFFNFRSDRIQQLADLVVTHCAATHRAVTVLSLAQYDTRAAIPPLVTRADATGGLADALTAAGLSSVRIAEAEKFEHVTYYINGRDGKDRDGEEHRRITADGPPDYRRYPQMNVDRVADAVIEATAHDGTDLVIANLANIDVVGHTGDFRATVRAAEHTDAAVARITEAAARHGRWVLLVGDHGNAESMTKTDPDGHPRPYGGHTTNPVPVVLVPAPEQPVDGPHTPHGTLADVAPTVLHLLGHEPSPSMTGAPLFTSAPGAPPHTDTADRTRALLNSLSTALLGGTPQDTGHLPLPARAAFAPDAVCRALSLDAGGWAVLRTAAGTNDRVLCVHNPTDAELAFTPADILTDDPLAPAPLVHLRGQMETAHGPADSVVCRLKPRAFVWLGRFATAPPVPPAPQ